MQITTNHSKVCQNALIVCQRQAFISKLSSCSADVLHIFPYLCLESDHIMRLCWHRLWRTVIYILNCKNLSLGRKRELVFIPIVYCFAYFVCVTFCLFFSSSLAAAFDCGTPWTFRLTFFFIPSSLIPIFLLLTVYSNKEYVSS